MSRPIPASALDLIRESEGLRLSAYRCPAGRWTIGYGHTGPDVHDGDAITLDADEALLRHDAAEAGAAVERLVTVPLTDGQFSALVDFVVNLGANALATSTLLKLLNLGRHDEAAKQLPLWKWATVNGKKVVLPGLVSRRAAEVALWNQVQAAEVAA